MGHTVNDLVNHMNKHRDAVVIIGPGAADYQTEKPTREMMEQLYTHKSMVRTPEKFWEFFRRYIYVEPDKQKPTRSLQNIALLNAMELLGAVVVQTTDGIFKLTGCGSNIFELHGGSTRFLCKSCGIEYPYMYYETFKMSTPECEVCGKPIRPETLLFGERYKDDVFNAIKHHITSTHTLFLVGMDYTEDLVAGFAADFCTAKSLANESPNADDHKMAIAVGIPENYDLNDAIGFFEFIVRDDPNAAMDRLIAAFRG